MQIFHKLQVYQKSPQVCTAQIHNFISMYLYISLLVVFLLTSREYLVLWFYFIFKFLLFLILYHLIMSSVAYINRWPTLYGQNICFEACVNVECTKLLLLPDYSFSPILMICHIVFHINNEYISFSVLLRNWCHFF